MNKEQEGKFDRWYGKAITGRRESELAWGAALCANGINTEEPVKDKTTIGPYDKQDAPNIFPDIDWESRPWADEVRIAYAKKNTPPDHICDRIMTISRPLPTWQPQDGEAVLYNAGTDIAGIGTYIKGRVYHGNQSFHVERSGARLKPYDGDETKIGRMWSDI
jgi:hypothetical protein